MFYVQISDPKNRKVPHIMRIHKAYTQTSNAERFENTHSFAQDQKWREKKKRKQKPKTKRENKITVNKIFNGNMKKSLHLVLVSILAVTHAKLFI